MRRESQPSYQTDVSPSQSGSDAVIVGMVVLVIVVLHIYRVMVIMSNPSHAMSDIVPFVLVIIGCMLFVYDTQHGKTNNGLMKLVALLIVAHMILPQLWGSDELRTSCSHLEDDVDSDNDDVDD